ncbi:MAG: dethiobiotin synthase [Verrucomicrobia bacterium]|nr:dethiobiotin synthase [Verrucomicrobiota bacterium]
MTRTWFITGTGTGVGKTVLTAAFARFLRERGVGVAALKPISSGSRSDALALRTAVDGALSLDEINPWHFRAPLAPLVAARLERKRVQLGEVLAHARWIQERFDAVLIEGAGGILSPMGDGFNSRDLIVALNAAPVVVTSNRLGAVNHVLLVLESLPRPAASKAWVVLMSPRRPNSASRTNAGLLEEFLHRRRVLVFPWLEADKRMFRASREPRVVRLLHLLHCCRPGKSDRTAAFGTRAA